LGCRILKDLSVTNEEIEKQSSKIATMKADQADVYDVKKQVRSARYASPVSRMVALSPAVVPYALPARPVERRRRYSPSASRRGP
jgi:hypothetical protein